MLYQAIGISWYLYLLTLTRIKTSISGRKEDMLVGDYETQRPIFPRVFEYTHFLN